MPDEIELLAQAQRAREGDLRAFESLVQLYQKKSVAMIDLDALQPVAERGAAFKAADAEIGFDENLLSEILGAVGVAGQVAAVGDDLLLIELDEGLESAQIALAGALGLGEEFNFVGKLGRVRQGNSL